MWMAAAQLLGGPGEARPRHPAAGAARGDGYGSKVLNVSDGVGSKVLNVSEGDGSKVLNVSDGYGSKVLNVSD